MRIWNTQELNAWTTFKLHVQVTRKNTEIIPFFGVSSMSNKLTWERKRTQSTDSQIWRHWQQQRVKTHYIYNIVIIIIINKMITDEIWTASQNAKASKGLEWSGMLCKKKKTKEKKPEGKWNTKSYLTGNCSSSQNVTRLLRSNHWVTKPAEVNDWVDDLLPWDLNVAESKANFDSDFPTSPPPPTSRPSSVTLYSYGVRLCIFSPAPSVLRL